MVVKGTNNGNKRKIDDVLLPTATTASRIPTPQSSPKNLCNPSAASPPICAKLNTIPRAQRKFAQGVVIPSPPVTPYKIPKTPPVRKVRIPQYSPPVKRPKTEDFLTFLCYRGTPALPKSLNFFNYPSHYDRIIDCVKVQPRNELKSWRRQSQSATQVSSSNASSSKQRSHRQWTDSKRNLSFKSAQKQTAKISKSIEAIHNKAEKGKEVGKLAKKSIIQPSPAVSSSQSVPLRKPTHINEQDAKFAISALKLKYQEKRLANSKSTGSVASKLAKKVKDRRVILTRSKSREDSGLKSTLNKPRTRVCSSQELRRRNAPSPDIIDGVKLNQPSGMDSSSSGSESTSSDDDSSKSSSSKRSEKEEKKARNDCTRTLRSGRGAVHSVSRTNSKPTSNKVPMPERISTRASRRNSASPLRELPMYGVVKRRKKKLKRDVSPARRRKLDKQQEMEKASSSGTSRRPSRKTKESAAFFLNLITKSFSSDENENGDKSEDQSEGDTSSSETKFLENRYKAIMKRDEQQKGKKSTRRTEQKVIPKKKSHLDEGNESTNRTRRPEKRILRSESVRKKEERKSSPVATRNSTRRSSVTNPPAQKPVHAGAARKSASVFPRKYKQSSSSSHSSSDSEDSSSSSSNGDNENRSEDRKKRTMCSKQVDSSSKSRGSAKRSMVNKKPQKVTEETSSEHGNDSDSDSDGAEVGENGSSTQESRCVGATASIGSGEVRKSESSYSSSSGSESDESITSSSEEEETVEKVEIAIQVDMDLEESLEQEGINAATQQPDETPPPVLTPHFMNQGCQSDFISSRSSPAHVHVSQQQPTITLPHAPVTSQIPLPHPPPPLVPFTGQNFYPSLTNFEFITQQRTQQDFSLMLGVPTVSAYSFGPSTVLTQNQIPGIPIGYSSTSISAATTLQTHIRSVAANLDIPLVRPVVTQTNLLSSLPLTRPSQMIDPNRPLTRPIVNSWPETSRSQATNHQPHQHYSAFRVPASTTVISGEVQSTLAQSGPPFHYPTAPQADYHRGQQQFQSHFGANRATSGVSQVLRRQTTTSIQSAHPGISAHGLSLIQSLPNVSIVPKFDRTAKTVVIRPDQQSTSSMSSVQEKVSPKKTSRAKEKTGPPKEKGRKRKVLPFTKEPSPLLVRKDSSNPITYVGKAKSSKKNVKGTEHEHQKESLSHPFNQLILNTEAVNEQTKKLPTISPSVVQERGNGSGVNVSHSHTNLQGNNDKALLNLGPTDSDAQNPKIAVENHNSEPTVFEKSDNKILEATEPIVDSNKSEKSSEKISKSKKSKSGEKPRGRKCGTESPRPVSVSSERSSRVSESRDDIKIEDILAYYPTEDEFQDPLKYIEQIKEEAQQFGIARIVPPKSFRPECNVEDDMRFTAYNHYIHRMHKRWGPNVHVRVGIMQHLKKSKIRVLSSNPPIIGGMEVDLTTLYHTVQSFGGLTEVIQKDKWNKVSDAMNIPKAANDRASKLDAVYVKYVLPYEMLSEHERKKLLNEVEKRWKVRVNKDPESESESDEDDPLIEVEDCIVKGKSTPLSSYYRVARNTMNMLFKNKDPTPNEVESSYWKLVRERDRHLCVYSGSIDCAGLGWGFPLPKNGSNHPWNLKVLANNPGSILKSMGSVMGATVPTLHVGMVFTTYCWYRDPHNLPWVEYLHSGGNKIWYVIPASHESNFRQVLKELMPRQCKDKKIWLTSDSAMVPPELLLSHGIPLFRAVQNPGEFLVVFPKAFTSAICTGYVISESVCFASPDWLKSALDTFKDIRESKEPPVFSLEKLLLSILSDNHVSTDILKMALPVAKAIFNEELALRKKLRDLGVGTSKSARSEEKGKKSNNKKHDDEVIECDTCNYVLHLSIVTHKSKKLNYCLPHAIKELTKKKSSVKASTLFHDETDAQLRSILNAAQSRVNVK